MKWLLSDIGKFLGLYMGCIITTYFLPNIASQLFFLFLLVLFYRSKKDYFWFALIFFLVDPPGGLFPMYDYNYGLPMYNLLPGSERLIYFQELFIFVALYKALKTGFKPKNVFRKPLVILAGYFIFLFLISFLFGINPLKVFKTVRNVLPWTLLFSVSVLIKSHEDWLNFFKLLFALLIVSVITQLLFIILNEPPAYLLGVDFRPMVVYEEIDYSAISAADPSKLRPISSPVVSLISLMGSMFYILYRGKTFKKAYLFFILFLAFFSILITATRGWLISYTVMMVMFIMIERGFFKRIIQLTILSITVIGLIIISPPIKNQVKNALNRLSTIERISEGDLTAGGTLGRLDEYSPKVMAKFYESPIFGWGFSNEYNKYGNGHVGNQTLLLSVGIFGYFLFIYFWFTICSVPIFTRQKLSVDNPLKNSLNVIPIVFVGFFILHSTSGQIFQYMISFYSGGFGQIFFYCFANFYILNAIDFEINSNPKQLNSVSFVPNQVK